MENTMFINCKNYEEATMANAIPLAQIAKKVAQETGKRIVLVVNAVELALIAKEGVEVWAQHIDPTPLGKGNGKVLPEVVKYYGAKGTVLNHAEHKVPNDILEESIKRAKECGLEVMVCAEDIERAKQIASFETKPDAIAVEPPELIGSDSKSVADSKPEIISGTVEIVKSIAPEIDVITGAGIKSKKDVEVSIELGTKGVFLASHIMRSEDKEKAIRDLVEGL